MSVRLVVESVSSSSRLRRSLSPGEAEQHGTLEGDELIVADAETAADLTARYPNVRYAADDPPEPPAGESVRFEADNDGVTTPEEDDGDEFDAAAFVDRTPVADVAADIGSGEYDAHLEAIEDAETSNRDRKTVYDAISERRA